MSGEPPTSPVVTHSRDRRLWPVWALASGVTVVAVLLLTGTSAHFPAIGPAPLAGVGVAHILPPAPPPLVLTGPTANHTAVDVTMAFNVTVIVTGGSNNGSNYNYTWKGLPTGCTNSFYVVENCTPTATGVFNVKVTVNDTVALVNATSAAITITVNPLPTLTSFSVTKTNLSVNSSITFTATTSGGTAPLNFVYTGLPLGCLSNVSTFSCTPNRPGLYHVTLSVVDSNKYASAKRAINVTVNSTASVATTSAGIGNTGWAIVGGIVVVGGIATVALLLQARREERAGRMGMEETPQGPPDLSGGAPPPGGGMPPGPQT